MSLKKIERKVLSGKRLTPDDALRLFQSNDIFSLGRLASLVSGRKNGNKVYYIQNHHINPSNICINRCSFCAFSRSKGDKNAYELSIQEIIGKIRNAKSKPCLPAGRGRNSFSEVHIVGGLHPDRPFHFYLDLIRAIKQSFPSIHIKAFTAVEIDHFSKISGLSIISTLRALRDAGLDSVPGGGAEIFNQTIRKRTCPEKITGTRWLEIMEKAHGLKIRSNATMLYGHYETYKHRVDHMLKLRSLQDRTGGFQAFIPLAFHPLNTGIQGRGHTSGIDDIKTIAVSRLFLDNFPHIKAYWIMLGEKIAQLALLFGADDLDGTIIEERITRSAGGTSGMAMTRTKLINLIHAAGKVPVERDSLYHPIPAPTTQ